jgi:PAS domain-containing protein
MEPSESWTALIQQPLFLQSGDAIMLLDSNGIIVQFNSECGRLLGVQRLFIFESFERGITWFL